MRNEGTPFADVDEELGAKKKISFSQSGCDNRLKWGWSRAATEKSQKLAPGKKISEERLCFLQDNQDSCLSRQLQFASHSDMKPKTIQQMRSSRRSNQKSVRENITRTTCNNMVAKTKTQLNVASSHATFWIRAPTLSRAVIASIMCTVTYVKPFFNTQGKSRERLCTLDGE